MKKKIVAMVIAVLLMSIIMPSIAFAESSGTGDNISYFCITNTENEVLIGQTLKYEYTLKNYADTLMIEIINTDGSTVESKNITDGYYTCAGFHDDGNAYGLLDGLPAGTYIAKLTSKNGDVVSTAQDDFSIIDYIDKINISTHTYVNDEWSQIAVSGRNNVPLAYPRTMFRLIDYRGATVWEKNIEHKDSDKFSESLKFVKFNEYLDQGNYTLEIGYGYGVTNTNWKGTVAKYDVVIQNPPAITTNNITIADEKVKNENGQKLQGSFVLNTKAEANISIYDEEDNLVKVLVDGSILDAGETDIAWDLTNQADLKVPNGRYYCVVSLSNSQGSKKIQSSNFFVTSPNSTANNIYDLKVSNENICLGHKRFEYQYSLIESPEVLYAEILGTTGEVVQKQVYNGNARTIGKHQLSISTEGLAVGTYTLRISCLVADTLSQTTQQFVVEDYLTNITFSSRKFVNDSWNYIDVSGINNYSSIDKEISIKLYNSSNKVVWSDGVESANNKNFSKKIVFIKNEKFFTPGNYTLKLEIDSIGSSSAKAFDVVIQNPPAITASSISASPIQVANIKNEKSKISFELNTSAKANVIVYNSGNEIIKRIVSNKVLASGSYSTTWDLTDLDNKRVPSGVYYYKITLENSQGKKTVSSSKFTVMNYNSESFEASVAVSNSSVVRNIWETITITTTKNHDGSDNLVIKNSAGKTVRILESGQVKGNKKIAYKWDLRSSSGKLVPSDKYTICYDTTNVYGKKIQIEKAIVVKNASKPVFSTVKLSKTSLRPDQRVKISAKLTQKAYVTLEAINSRGKVIRTIWNNVLRDKGSFSKKFALSGMRKGAYALRLTATNSAGTTKISKKYKVVYKKPTVSFTYNRGKGQFAISYNTFGLRNAKVYLNLYKGSKKVASVSDVLYSAKGKTYFYLTNYFYYTNGYGTYTAKVYVKSAAGKSSIRTKKIKI